MARQTEWQRTKGLYDRIHDLEGRHEPPWSDKLPTRPGWYWMSTGGPPSIIYVDPAHGRPFLDEVLAGRPIYYKGPIPVPPVPNVWRGRLTILFEMVKSISEDDPCRHDDGALEGAVLEAYPIVNVGVDKDTLNEEHCARRTLHNWFLAREPHNRNSPVAGQFAGRPVMAPSNMDALWAIQQLVRGPGEEQVNLVFDVFSRHLR